MKKGVVIFPDFQKLDIRVGEIKNAKPLEGSRNIIQLTVDLGEDYGVVEILAGIAGYYKPEELIGNKYAVLANLEPKKILDHYSNGMMLAADEGEKCVLLALNKNLKNGTVIR